VATKPKPGRPRVRTDEERKTIRNECSLRNYYENRDLRLERVRTYYNNHREEILNKQRESKIKKKKDEALTA
jgi:hypothetical protein